MKITFLGVNGALEGGKGKYNSNMLVETDKGKTLLVDAGSDLPHSLEAAGRKIEEIDAVYISHLHADHCGGLEWLGYLTYFHPELKKLPLYIHPDFEEPLWENSLKAGMEEIHGRTMTLKDYFEVKKLKPGKVNFKIDELKFGLLRMPHVEDKVYSYGLLIENDKEKRVFITTDTSGKYDALTNLAVTAQFIVSDYIFHDCTIGYTTPVHASYDDLKMLLPSTVKAKTWLYHYSSNVEKPNYKADGFAGFVETGQVFKI